MRKTILLTVILLSVSAALSAAASKIKISKGTYTLMFKNSSAIEDVSFISRSDIETNSSKGIQVNVKGKNITVNGVEPDTVIASLELPEGRKYTVKNNDSSMTFSKEEIKIVTDGGTSVIEQNKNGLYLRDEDNVVKISDNEIVVNSNNSKVNLSNDGIIIKDDGEEIKLGIIGKLISKITKSIVGRTLNKNLDNIDMITESMNDIINDRNVSMSYSTVEIGSKHKDLKTEITDYTYEGVRSIKTDLVASDVVINKGTGKNTSLKIIKKYVPTKNYKIVIDQDGDTLNVKEKIRGTVTRVSVKFIFTVPDLDMISVNTTSGDVMIKDIRTDKIHMVSTSGNFTGFDIKTGDADIVLTSGDVFLNNVTVKNEFRARSVSGDIKLNKTRSDDIEMVTTSGDIEADGIYSKNTRIKTVSGDVEIYHCETDKMTFKSTSGDLETTDSKIVEFSGSSVSGDAVFTNSTIKSKKYSSISGSIEEVSLNCKTMRKAG